MQPLEATAEVDRVSDEDEEVVRVLDAYLANLELGHSANPELLLAQHPGIAHRLRPCLAGLQLLDSGIRTSEAATQLGDYTILREIGRVTILKCQAPVSNYTWDSPAGGTDDRDTASPGF